MKNTSLFVVIDGIDGSGKSLMSQMLVSYLIEKGCGAVHTFEPTSGHYGQRVRHILTADSDPKKNAELCLELFTKDREEHLTQFILPSLKQGKYVVCDRYYYSTIVYQHLQGIEWDKVIGANKNFRKPDIAFILDLPVGDDKAIKNSSAGTAVTRIKERGSATEKFEDKAFLKELRKAFLELNQKLEDNIIVIDASKPKEEVFAFLTKEVDKLIKI